MSRQPPIVSFIVVSRCNPAGLRALVLDLQQQDYPHICIDVLIVDADCREDERAIASYLASRGSFKQVRLFINEKKTLAAGWNIALTQALGEVLLRVDAHSRIPREFVRRSVEAIQNGERVCGGHRVTIEPRGAWRRVLFVAEASKFGGAPAAFRHPGPRRYVDTIAHAAYARSVFDLVGGYDERLVRNQDIEIHSRMRAAGIRFLYDPALVSYHEPRHTLRSLIRQKFLTGRWIGLLLGLRPAACKPRHLVPCAFVLGTTLATAALLAHPGQIATGAVGMCSAVYILTSVVFSVRSALENGKDGRFLALPLVFLAIHLAYGLGTLLGLVEAPAFCWRTRAYTVPFPTRGLSLIRAPEVEEESLERISAPR